MSDVKHYGGSGVSLEAALEHFNVKEGTMEQSAILQGDDLMDALRHFDEMGVPDDMADNILEHYGVMGMKWGKTRAKATKADIHKARRNLIRKNQKIGEVEDSLTGDAKKDAKNIKKLEKLEKELREDPQRVLAARLTKGEKVGAVLLAGPFGLAAIAASSAASRGIERRQDKRAGRKS